MPIPRQLFDQEIDPLDRKILDILDGDPVQAYSANDLAAQLKLTPLTLASEMAFYFRLEDLRRKQLIVARSIHGMQYYASAKGRKA